MNCISNKYAKPALVLCIVLFLLFSSAITWGGMLNFEDLIHFQSRTISEALGYARDAYNQTNPRIGEMSMFLIGCSESGTGSFYPQYLHYIFTPLFLLAAALLIYRLAIGQWVRAAWSPCIILSFIMLCLLGAKQNFFWFAGNMCWLYPTVFAMLFFVIWEGIFKGDFRVSHLAFAASIPLALIVAFSNENVSTISFLVFSGTGLYYSIKQKKICFSWQYMATGLVMLIFLYFFCTAPCRAARANQAHWELSFENILFHSLLDPTNWMYTAIFYWREAIVLIFLLWTAARQRTSLRDCRLLVICGTIFLLWSVLIAAPCWGAPRAYTPIDMMIAAVSARLLHLLLKDSRSSPARIMFSLGLRSALTLTLLVPLVVLTQAQYKVRRNLEKLAQDALSAGKTDLVIRKDNLGIKTVMPRFFHIPGCIVPHDLTPHLPLIPISEEDFNNRTDFTHVPLFSYSKDFKTNGDDVLNRGVAKRFGLNSIIYILPNQPKATGADADSRN